MPAPRAKASGASIVIEFVSSGAGDRGRSDMYSAGAILSSSTVRGRIGSRPSADPTRRAESQRAAAHARGVETRPRLGPLSEASRLPPSAIRSEQRIQRDRASQQYQVGADAASGAAESPCAEAYQGFAFPLASRLRTQPIAIPRVDARDGVRRSKAEATNSCRVRG